MAMIVDEVIDGIKARSLFVSNQITISDDQLLSFLNSVIQLDLVGLIDSTNQEFFVRTIDIPIVAGQNSYRIPYRAMGRQIRDLKYYDPNDTSPRTQNMVLINIDDLQFYQVGYKNFASFYFKGDSIVIVPDVPSQINGSPTLQCWYKLKPNRPCFLDDSATVISVASNTITVNAVPSNITAGTLIDFIQGKEGCDIYSYDKTVTNITDSTITFASGDIPSELSAGDYISLAQTSPVINMIPDEAQPLIEDRTARLLLRSIGDIDGSRTFDGTIKDMETALLKMVEPRTDGQPQVILNRYSLSRGRRYWYGLYGGGVVTP